MYNPFRTNKTSSEVSSGYRSPQEHHDIIEDPGRLIDEKRERRFVRKLDLILVTWAFFAYLMKMIDGTNYKTAYASGMKEELGMTGNELNWMDIYYRIGYAIFLLPCQIILTKVRPNWWLPSMEMAWGLMTALMAAVKNVKIMYTLRFFIGVFEASSYPGIISILCNWYTPREVAVRVVFFSTSYPVSAMFVSAMQASLSKTLDGSSGLSGWRWLFIFNAIMTFIVAIAGYFMVPDSPGTTKIFWMSSQDNKIARERMDRCERLPSSGYSMKLVGSVFKSPMTYVFVLAYSTWSFSQDSNGWFILFLKSVLNDEGKKRFNVTQINAINIPAYALMLLAMLLFAFLHSSTGWYVSWIVVQESMLLVGVITLTIWPAGFTLKLAAFFLLFCSDAVGPILVGWMSQYFRTPEERSIVIGLAVTFVFPMSAWMSIVFYPAKHAPQYPIGYKAPIAFAILCMLFTLLFQWLASHQPSIEVCSAQLDDSPIAEKVDLQDHNTSIIVPTLRS